MTKPMDPEVKSLKAIWRNLAKHDWKARDRMLRWAFDKAKAYPDPPKPVTIEVGGKDQ